MHVGISLNNCTPQPNSSFYIIDPSFGIFDQLDSNSIAPFPVSGFSTFPLFFFPPSSPNSSSGSVLLPLKLLRSDEHTLRREKRMEEGRSLAETPTWSVATVTTVMVFVCFVVERSIYRFGKWLKKTRRKALFASLEKTKEELMLLGLISLLLGQWARWISEICVDSSLFNSRFYLCSEEDFGVHEHQRFLSEEPHSSTNETVIPRGLTIPHQCREGYEPFVSYAGLEQLHRFLFVLGITHVLYSCLAVALAMTKIYSWRKWESQAFAYALEAQAKNRKVMRRQTTFAFHHASHPWSRNRVLIWMLCFLKQFKSSIRKSDYLALRLGFVTNHRLPLSYNFHKYMVRSMEDEFHAIVGISWPLWGYAILCIFINIHGLNTYFWLSFIPAILVMLVGTKLEHVVSVLAVEISGPSAPSGGDQVKPRDELFWFGKPGIILKLIQFISFQNAFEMATFIWSLWGFRQRSCFMKNHAMVVTRLASGLLVQFWCSYSTVPLSVIITQMGSKCKKALVAESVRESLHSWCKRVKDKSRRSHTARSVCSIDEIDETTTVASLTISRCSSAASLNELTVVPSGDIVQSQGEGFGLGTSIVSDAADRRDNFAFDRVSDYISQTAEITFAHPPDHEEGVAIGDVEEGGFESLYDLIQRTKDDI